MNAVIHLFAAAASIALVFYILHLQRRSAFVTQLLKDVSHGAGPEKIRLVDPIKFLIEFTTVLAIPIEYPQSLSLPLGKVRSRIWTETFLRYGIRLIRCDIVNGAASIEVGLWSAEAVVGELEDSLAKGLGANVRVSVRLPEHNQSQISLRPQS